MECRRLPLKAHTHTQNSKLSQRFSYGIQKKKSLLLLLLSPQVTPLNAFPLLCVHICHREFDFGTRRGMAKEIEKHFPFHNFFFLILFCHSIFNRYDKFFFIFSHSFIFPYGMYMQRKRGKICLFIFVFTFFFLLLLIHSRFC